MRFTDIVLVGSQIHSRAMVDSDELDLDLMEEASDCLSVLERGGLWQRRQGGRVLYEVAGGIPYVEPAPETPKEKDPGQFFLRTSLPAGELLTVHFVMPEGVKARLRTSLLQAYMAFSLGASRAFRDPLDVREWDDQTEAALLSAVPLCATIPVVWPGEEVEADLMDFYPCLAAAKLLSDAAR